MLRFASKLVCDKRPRQETFDDKRSRQKISVDERPRHEMRVEEQPPQETSGDKRPRRETSDDKPSRQETSVDERPCREIRRDAVAPDSILFLDGRVDSAYERMSTIQEKAHKQSGEMASLKPAANRIHKQQRDIQIELDVSKQCEKKRCGEVLDARAYMRTVLDTIYQDCKQLVSESENEYREALAIMQQKQEEQNRRVRYQEQLLYSLQAQLNDMKARATPQCADSGSETESEEETMPNYNRSKGERECYQKQKQSNE